VSDVRDLRPITLQREPGCATVSLTGTVNIMLADELLQAARQAASAPRVVVRLEDVEHLDTAALQILVALRHAVGLGGGACEVTGVPERVAGYLRLAGLIEAVTGTADREPG